MKIIVAYDGSAPARNALAKLAWFHGAAPDVLIVTVLNGMALDADGNPIDPDPTDASSANEELTTLVNTCRSFTGGRVEYRILVGDARKVLLKEVHSEMADLLILGSRGMGLGQRIVFGSVSTDMLHHATCAVMVVK